MGILLWSSVTKTFFLPSLWTLEMAQFAMVAYYMLGGPYSIQMGSNVRMDLFYGDWGLRRKAWFDAVTVLFLIFYLAVLLYGGVSSTAYSLGYWGSEPFSYLTGIVTGAEEVGRAERSSSAWRPYMWPIKVVMVHRHLPDAAAMPVGAFQGRAADPGRGDLMSYEMIATLMFSTMMLMLMTGQRVFGAIGFVAVVAALAALGRQGGFDIGFSAAMKLMKWYPLLTLPMFIFMGYVLSESKIADDLYRCSTSGWAACAAGSPSAPSG